jgi:hypothetical protein
VIVLNDIFVGLVFGKFIFSEVFAWEVDVHILGFYG